MFLKRFCVDRVVIIEAIIINKFVCWHPSVFLLLLALLNKELFTRCYNKLLTSIFRILSKAGVTDIVANKN